MEVTSPLIRLLRISMLLLAQHFLFSHCQGAAVLLIDPSRLQFFEYETVRLNCEGSTGSAEWRVIKDGSSKSSTGSLTIHPAFAYHSGEYWCENGEGEKSNTLHISVVTGSSVILESPVFPVMEGQTVTLLCRRNQPPYNQTADFYRNGQKERTEYKGTMIIQNVSKSSEGSYKCKISGSGESPEIRLAVEESSHTQTEVTPSQEGQRSSPHPPEAESNHLSTLLPVIFTFVVVLLLLVGLFQWRRKAACFSTNTPTERPDPVYEQVGAAEQQEATYAKVQKTRRKTGIKTYALITTKKIIRGHQELLVEDVSYAEVTAKNRVRGAAYNAESNMTYASVRPQGRGRGNGPRGADSSLHSAYE